VLQYKPDFTRSNFRDFISFSVFIFHFFRRRVHWKKMCKNWKYSWNPPDLYIY